MKKRWLLFLIVGIMSISIFACKGSEENSSVVESSWTSSSTSSIEATQSSTLEESLNPEYSLGDFENENENDWWDSINNSSEIESSEEESSSVKDSDVTGETLPY